METQQFSVDQFVFDFKSRTLTNFKGVKKFPSSGHGRWDATRHIVGQIHFTEKELKPLKWQTTDN